MILGAGGLGQEIAWLIEEINDHSPEWRILGFLDSDARLHGESVLGYPVLGGDREASKLRGAGFVLGVGDPPLRKRIVERLRPEVTFWPTLISPTARVHGSNSVGVGVVLGRFADMTVGCVIGDFVMINIHAVLGHAVQVGEYSIVDPNVTINGEARVGRCCLIGANAFVRDVAIGDHATVGAGAVVVKDVPENCVVAGVPARVIRTGTPDHTLTRSERRT